MSALHNGGVSSGEVPPHIQILAALLGAVEHPPFESLVQAGMAGDYVEAVETVAAASPPPGETSWDELSCWVEEYGSHERP